MTLALGSERMLTESDQRTAGELRARLLALMGQVAFVGSSSMARESVALLFLTATSTC